LTLAVQAIVVDIVGNAILIDLAERRKAPPSEQVVAS
jgi:hypothetical protein